MDIMNEGMAQPSEMMEEQGEAAEGSVTIAKEGNAFTVNGKPAATIEEALTAARVILTQDDGGMSVEQAFGQGFKGDSVGGSSY